MKTFKQYVCEMGEMIPPDADETHGVLVRLGGLAQKAKNSLNDPKTIQFLMQQLTSAQQVLSHDPSSAKVLVIINNILMNLRSPDAMYLIPNQLDKLSQIGRV